MKSTLLSFARQHPVLAYYILVFAVSGGSILVALAVATLGYYFRRRGPCKVCGRGAAVEARRS